MGKSLQPLHVGIALILVGFFFIGINHQFFDITGSIIMLVSGILLTWFHFRKPENWWAIIPGGLFFIISAIIFIYDRGILNDEYYGFLFFAGLSLVFWYLYWIRTDENKLGWAKIPAVIIALFAFFVLLLNFIPSKLLVPVSIIGSGAYLVCKNFHRNHLNKHNQPEANERH